MSVSSSKAHPLTLAANSYWEHSRRPLHVLVFLLPLILVYEMGVMLLRGDLSNVAHLTLLRFFRAMSIPSVSGLYMGGVAIIVVLVTWQILAAQPWRVRWPVIGGMALESCSLALPLVFINILLHSAVPAAATTVSMEGLSLTEKLVISLGAGLYEELLFRMLLIGMLHTLLVDVAGASNRLGCLIAIVVSAAAFTWYHTVGQSEPVATAALVFWMLAGLYFGATFLMRGFGIVVAAHALHNLFILSI